VSAIEITHAPDGFHTFRLRLESDASIGERVADLAHQQGWRLRELKRDDRSLEQVFRELTTSVAGANA
jgi:hypothetical protein